MPTLSYIASNVVNTTQFTSASQRAVTQLGAVVCAKTSRLVQGNHEYDFTGQLPLLPLTILSVCVPT